MGAGCCSARDGGATDDDIYDSLTRCSVGRFDGDRLRASTSQHGSSLHPTLPNPVCLPPQNIPACLLQWPEERG